MTKQDIFDTLYKSAKKLSMNKLVSDLEKYFNDAKTNLSNNWSENFIKANWDNNTAYNSHTIKVISPDDIKISAEWSEVDVKWGDGAGGYTLKEISSITIYFHIGNKDVRYWISLNKQPTLHKHLDEDYQYRVNYIGAGIFGKDFDYRKPDIAKEFEKLLYSDETTKFISNLLKNCSYPFVWYESDESSPAIFSSTIEKISSSKDNSSEV